MPCPSQYGFSFMYPYPANIGIKIPKHTSKVIDVSKINVKNTIITFYGLPSTGKGTVATKISKILNLPHFDTGLLYRVITHYFTNNNLEINSVNLKNFEENLKLEPVNGQIEFSLFSHRYSIKELRHPDIEPLMSNFTHKLEIREVVDEIISEFVSKTSFVTDGRGAYDGYIVKAEKKGVKIVRVLLQAKQEERIRRRFIDYVNLHRGEDLSDTEILNLWKKCVKTVKFRDEEEINKEITLNLGMISDDSGVIDTTNLTINEVVTSVLNWLVQN